MLPATSPATCEPWPYGSLVISPPLVATREYASLADVPPEIPPLPAIVHG